MKTVNKKKYNWYKKDIKVKINNLSTKIVDKKNLISDRFTKIKKFIDDS